MQVSQRCLDMIKGFEGLRLKAYHDAIGVLTIGFGHTGSDVTEGLVITEPDAEALLRKDLAHFEQGVETMAGPTTQGRFDALVDFAFNVGLANLAGSTLLKKHKAGDFTGAANEFLKWNHAGGQVLPGLTRRRAQERSLYIGGAA